MKKFTALLLSLLLIFSFQTSISATPLPMLTTQNLDIKKSNDLSYWNVSAKEFVRIYNSTATDETKIKLKKTGTVHKTNFKKNSGYLTITTSPKGYVSNVEVFINIECTKETIVYPTTAQAQIMVMLSQNSLAKANKILEGLDGYPSKYIIDNVQYDQFEKEDGIYFCATPKS